MRQAKDQTYRWNPCVHYPGGLTRCSNGTENPLRGGVSSEFIHRVIGEPCSRSLHCTYHACSTFKREVNDDDPDPQAERDSEPEHPGNSKGQGPCSQEFHVYQPPPCGTDRGTGR